MIFTVNVDLCPISVLMFLQANSIVKNLKYKYMVLLFHGLIIIFK